MLHSEDANVDSDSKQARERKIESRMNVGIWNAQEVSIVVQFLRMTMYFFTRNYHIIILSHHSGNAIKIRATRIRLCVRLCSTVFQFDHQRYGGLFE
jgi:hypothetical protein